jgi:hypothetical protein
MRGLTLLARPLIIEFRGMNVPLQVYIQSTIPALTEWIEPLVFGRLRSMIRELLTIDAPTLSV